MLTSREKIPVLVFDDHEAVADRVAGEIVAFVQKSEAAGVPAVLGLATGSTSLGVYRRLIEAHQNGGVSFRNCVTFNLDEYYPMSPDSLQSHHQFMFANLFDYLDLPRESIHLLRGDLLREKALQHCEEYEQAIREVGGIGLQILGLGRMGHIGFNEPGSLPGTRTRLIRLDEVTRKDAAADFFGEGNVPEEAVSMGVGTLLESRRLLLVATGEHKAAILRRAVEGDVGPEVAASYLQNHADVTFFVDLAAARELTRIKTPWLVEDLYDWDRRATQRAALWLCDLKDKSILTLQRQDYSENRLFGLLKKYESVDHLNQTVFDWVRHKIHERKRLFRNRRCICFSPHPDDDVISMGGTLLKLSRVGNEITVAYMTSGNIAVFDHDVLRHLDFILLTMEDLGYDSTQFRVIADRVRDFLQTKEPTTVDLPEVQVMKTNIRRTEAIAGAGVLGIPPHRCRFLDLPFYHTGEVRKSPISEEDVGILLHLMEEVRPDVVFVAGDLSDPHGTHSVCKEAIYRALDRYSGESPEVWLYRGAWQEWDVDEADVLIPLSHDEFSTKLQAIFKHESQKDSAMFPGACDDREFWERVQQRNTTTARLLHQFGLPEYYAMEAFVVETMHSSPSRFPPNLS
ncbi:MAG: glucosamine-6-phosphate deaminase [Armatimonadetes bacterium]|nr:glucosamine-6-phosphate deaminase [Armatimonadota bacterium]